MATHKPKVPDFYIIVVDSGEDIPELHLDFTRVNLTNDPQYAELVRKEKNRELKSPHPTVVPRACLNQTPDMLVEDYFDEKANQNKRRFKAEMVEAFTDDTGRIWIDKDKPDLAREILRGQRELKRKAWLDDMGCLLPEELPPQYRNQTPNRGGRPRKDKFEGLTDV